MEEDFPVGGEDRHGHLSVDEEDDSFGHFASGDVDGLGDFLGGVGRGVLDTDVFDVLVIEQGFEAFDWHGMLLGLEPAAHRSMGVRRMPR